ncbi:DinB family protein [Saccharopolyspora sp. NFXS83]|uniref:DinB family protein n=1 Tax=Saccharopolyspora sp. NFXS83 TaxID=2993560 RepID=UPI00224B9634|nr:DinB family protein [Saccharopolyspora sp. NFXS83]MCX2729542.1 DinB family protein [Saccharopolyspora sp. NFXS83]
MGETTIAEDLLHYLQQSRDTVLRGLDGLGEYDARRPLTPSGSNVLGLIKHLAGVESGYLGDCAGRPSPVRLPWVEDGSIWDGADMWATAEQSRGHLVGLYREACAHSDRVVAELPLGAPAHVPWWPPHRRDTTLGHLLARVVAETAQHAGHVDVLREGVDGRGGPDHDAFGDAEHWAAYVGRIQAAADEHRG